MKVKCFEKNVIIAFVDAYFQICYNEQWYYNEDTNMLCLWEIRNSLVKLTVREFDILEVVVDDWNVKYNKDKE